MSEKRIDTLHKIILKRDNDLSVLKTRLKFRDIEIRNLRKQNRGYKRIIDKVLVEPKKLMRIIDAKKRYDALLTAYKKLLVHNVQLQDEITALYNENVRLRSGDNKNLELNEKSK